MANTFVEINKGLIGPTVSSNYLRGAVSALKQEGGLVLPSSPLFYFEISRESCRTPSNGQHYAEPQSSMPAHLKIHQIWVIRISSSPFEIYSQQDLINNGKERNRKNVFPDTARCF